MSYMERMAVTVPEGTSGDVRVERFTVSESASRLDAVLNLGKGTGRHCQPGTYTRLLRGRQLWMSDTLDERSDHVGFVYRVESTGAGHVLVNGLGLGMVLAGLVHVPTVRRIDVCEIDPDVIALVGPHVTELGRDHGIAVDVRQGDAFAPLDTWGKGYRWDAAWHDIWPTITADDYEDHKRMRRTYRSRVTWQGVWADDQVRDQVRREKAWLREQALWRGR